ncbi:efflux RND transporter periplasmic adaptor subunit [Paenibacillus monticola]|uniref:Efflux RND transporter periplasmic adaptor subunit n=1 Tax=Paenibacillus monticola TaxID=2666075 RepID=A0A7X2H7U5_9BACL|nr:efflux RND transporter periplasmic adaptor subunit [Paenibacillus monticola]MRN55136.1 efflux RND transporter periplasmic adaptor subunit [Paenibacillus monticola]
MKRIIKWIVIVVIVVVAGYFIYDKMIKPKEQLAPVEEVQVISFPVTKETMTKSIQIKGTSKYEYETLVYAPFASKVTDWKVENGGQVKKGEVMYTLDTTTLKNEIATQEATIRKGELEAELNKFVSQQNDDSAAVGTTEAERLKTLATQETARISDDLNKVNADIQAREIADKKDKIQSASYRAPSSGIFLFDNSSEIPQMVTDNQYIGKIVDLSKLEFIALVGEQDVFSIKAGMKVKVKMTASKDVLLSGEVKKVSKFATTASGKDTTTTQAPQFEVIISLQPNELLIGGLSLSGEIETLRKENVTAVSNIAVIHEGELSYVMLDKGNGQTERREIKTGLETTDKVEVMSGLKPGDTVVLQ